MPRVHILVLAAAVALVCFTVVAHAQLLLDPAFTFADPYIPTSSLFNYDPSTHVFDAPLPLRAPLGPLNVTFQRPEGLRWFYLYVSSLALNASLQGPLTIPLLYHWHGYGSSAGEGLAVAQAGVEAGGWALISGSGTFGPQPFQPTGRGFNAGYCCTLQAVGAPLYQPDDVTFGLTALQATRDLLKPYNISIDPDRIFSQGMSNGGMMSERLGCEAPTLFRAIASVTGVTVELPMGANGTAGLATCDSYYANATANKQQSRSFSVLHVHGTTDATVPWLGGGGLGFPSVPDDIAAWAARLGCNPAQSTQTLNNGIYSNAVWSACAYAGSQLELVTVQGGNHTWFNTPGVFSASSYTIAFFQRVAPANGGGSGGDDEDSGVSGGVIVAVVLVVLLVAVAAGVFAYRRSRSAQQPGGDGAGASFDSASTARPRSGLRARLNGEEDGQYTAM